MKSGLASTVTLTVPHKQIPVTRLSSAPVNVTWPLPQQFDFACAAAALNCTASGARGGIRPVPEIEATMAACPRYAAAPALD
jgi:hypothetical protein